MSSRQQEKERRREERLAAEQAAAASAARRRRIGVVVGGGLALAAVAAVAIALTAGGSTSSKKKASTPTDAVVVAKARAAGCTAQTLPSEGRTHTTSPVKYRTNPPTSGNHYPVPASDGVYDPGGTPEVTHLVHALEHGRVQFQYKPGTPPSVIAQLTALMQEPVKGQAAGHSEMLFQNTTGMPYQVAAVAWTHLLGCPTFQGAKTLDALRAFRDAYVDKGPEFIPTPE
jgi:hypothetical protein